MLYISKSDAFAIVAGIANIERDRGEILATALIQVNKWREANQEDSYDSFPRGERHSMSKCPVAVAIGHDSKVMPISPTSEGYVIFSSTEHERELGQRKADSFSARLNTQSAGPARAHLPLALSLVGCLFDHGFYQELEVPKADNG